MIRGIVTRGKQLGRTLGFPTANLYVPVSESDGVYAAQVWYRDQEYLAAASLGTNPTFHEQVRVLELHLLDFNQEIYGEELMVKLGRKLRDQQAFSSLDALIAQIHQDILGIKT